MTTKMSQLNQEPNSNYSNNIKNTMAKELKTPSTTPQGLCDSSPPSLPLQQNFYTNTYNSYTQVLFPKQASRSLEESRLFSLDGRLPNNEQQQQQAGPTTVSRRRSLVESMSVNSMDSSGMGLNSTDSSSDEDTDDAVSSKEADTFTTSQKLHAEHTKQIALEHKNSQVLNDSELIMNQVEQNEQAKGVLVSVKAKFESHWHLLKGRFTDFSFILTPTERRLNNEDSKFYFDLTSRVDFTRWTFWWHLANSLLFLIIFILLELILLERARLNAISESELLLVSNRNSTQENRHTLNETRQVSTKFSRFGSFIDVDIINRSDFWVYLFGCLISIMILINLFSLFWLWRNSTLTHIKDGKDYLPTGLFFKNRHVKCDESEKEHEKALSTVINVEGIIEKIEISKPLNWRLIILKVFAYLFISMLIFGFVCVTTLSLPENESLSRNLFSINKNINMDNTTQQTIA